MRATYPGPLRLSEPIITVDTSRPLTPDRSPDFGEEGAPGLGATGHEIIRTWKSAKTIGATLSPPPASTYGWA